jgi:hypothetical protein
VLANDGTMADLSMIPGRSMVYIYPPQGGGSISHCRLGGTKSRAPAAARRSLVRILTSPPSLQLSAPRVFGLSTQKKAYQQEAVARLHLPFLLLSDERLRLTTALSLPTFEVDGMTLIKRLPLVIDDGEIEIVLYPDFPPDADTAIVAAWLREHRA